MCHFLQDSSNINSDRKKRWLPKYSFPSLSCEGGCHLMLAGEHWGDDQVIFYCQNPPNTFSSKLFCQQPCSALANLIWHQCIIRYTGV